MVKIVTNIDREITMIKQTSNLISPTPKEIIVTINKSIQELEIVEEKPKKNCIARFYNWFISHPTKAILLLATGVTVISGAVIASILLAPNNNSSAGGSSSLTSRNIKISPARDMQLLTKKLSPSSRRINILPTASRDSFMAIETAVTKSSIEVSTNEKLLSSKALKTTRVTKRSSLTSEVNILPITSIYSTYAIETTLVHSILKSKIKPTKTFVASKNKILTTVNNDFSLVSRPYAEYEKAGYLIFSDDDFYKSRIKYYESKKIKQKIVKDMPDDVQLIVYTYKNKHESIRRKLKGYIGKKSLHILTVNKGKAKSKFWTRDAVPVPVYGNDGKLKLIDAKYHKDFEDDKAFADFLNVTLYSHKHEFEGGNFLADSNANCFTIDNIYTPKSDEFFKKYYGCNRMTRFKHIKGIGHIDESLKIIDSNNILTDVVEYQPILKDLGYNVTLMPRPTGSTKKSYANYLNSLLINNKVFLPIYNKDTDADAIQIYTNFNLTVYPLKSSRLAKESKGSIHCITMTYPPV